MKKIITAIFILLIFTLSLSAMKVSLRVPEKSKLMYKDVLYTANEKSLISLEISDTLNATLILEDETSYPVTFVKTDEAIITWTTSELKDLPLSYILNGQESITLDSNAEEVVLKNLEPNVVNTFILEANNSECAKTAVVSLKEKKNNFSLRFAFSPYSIAAFDFCNAHSISDAKYFTASDYGFSTDVDLIYQSSDNILLSLNTSYSYEKKEETIIPNAFIVSYLKLGCGLDFKTLSDSKLSPSLGIFTGALLAINANMYSISPMLGARVCFNYKLNDFMYLGLQSKFTLAYNHASDDLYKSLTYLIDPIMLALQVKL